MSESQFGTNANRERKRVMYEGVDIIREGMPVAYNYDTTDNINGINTGVDPVVKSGTTAEGGQNEGKFQRVELCTVANAAFFAGVVAGTSFAGLTGTGQLWIDIYVANGSIVPVRTDKSITIKDKLYLEAGQQTVVNDSTAMPCIGVAVETVDKSAAAGIVLAKINAIKACDEVETVTSSSRTAVQLPTADIWDNFNLKELRENPFAGSLYEADFRRNSDFAMDSFIDATYAATAAGKTPTEGIYPGSEAVGDLVLFSTTDNQAAEMQVPCPIVVSGGKKWGFECRVKVSEVTAAQNNFFGLMVAALSAGNKISDTGVLADVGALGFQKKEGDPDIIDFVYDENSQTQNEHDPDYATLVLGTYVTLGMYFNGTTIQGYLDGVLTGTAISAVDIAAADFPTGAVMVPTLAVKAGDAADYTTNIDWIRVAQEG